MAFYINSLNFPNLTAKGTPVGADLVLIADSAAGNILKQATITNVLAVGGGASALTFIATATATNSASVNFDNKITSTYDNYLLVWENFLAATASTSLLLQVGTGATPTYQTTTYTTAISPSINATTAGIALGAAANGNTANRVGAGNAYFTNANNASNDKVAVGHSGFWNASATDAIFSFSGRWPNATVITSLRLIMGAGNITSGTFKLYGLSN